MDTLMFKLFIIFGIVSRWVKTALEDRKVTLIEACALASEICAEIGIDAEIEIPTALPAPLPEQEQIDETFDADAETEQKRPPPRT